MDVNQETLSYCDCVSEQKDRETKEKEKHKFVEQVPSTEKKNLLFSSVHREAKKKTIQTSEKSHNR